MKSQHLLQTFGFRSFYYIIIEISIVTSITLFLLISVPLETPILSKYSIYKIHSFENIDYWIYLYMKSFSFLLTTDIIRT